MPIALEPDTASDGFVVVGASKTSISALGVERYEAAAYDIAAQALKPGKIRDALVTCKPVATTDDVCARHFVGSFGRRGPLGLVRLRRSARRRPHAGEPVAASLRCHDETWAGLAGVERLSQP